MSDDDVFGLEGMADKSVDLFSSVFGYVLWPLAWLWDNSRIVRVVAKASGNLVLIVLVPVYLLVFIMLIYSSFSSGDRVSFRNAEVSKEDLGSSSFAFEVMWEDGDNLENLNNTREKTNASDRVLLNVAMDLRYRTIVESLLKSGLSPDEDLDDRWDEPTNFGPCRYNDDVTLKLLIKYGTDLTQVDFYCQTSLEVAAFHGSKKCVEILRGEQIESGYPLHIAAGIGDMESVSALLEGGAPIDERTLSMGRTPLHFAIHAKQWEVVDHLIKCGADIEMPSRNQETPLHLAVEKCNTALVKVLIEKGAYLNSAVRGCWTPLDEAEDGSEIEALLLAHGAKSFGDMKIYYEDSLIDRHFDHHHSGQRHWQGSMKSIQHEHVYRLEGFSENSEARMKEYDRALETNR